MGVPRLAANVVFFPSNVVSGEWSALSGLLDRNDRLGLAAELDPFESLTKWWTIRPAAVAASSATQTQMPSVRPSSRLRERLGRSADSAAEGSGAVGIAPRRYRPDLARPPSARLTYASVTAGQAGGKQLPRRVRGMGWELVRGVAYRGSCGTQMLG